MHCVIPAAGRSIRMGAWKPGLPFRGDTVIGTVARTAALAGLSVVIVSGYRAEDTVRLLESVPDCVVIRNPLWRNGMLGSIQAALRELGHVPFLTIPGDMPLVSESVYAEVLRTVDSRGMEDEDVPVFPVFHGTQGHPVYVPAHLVATILSMPSEARLRPFLRQSGAVDVAVDDSAILFDIDVPDDYRRAVERH